MNPNNTHLIDLVACIQLLHLCCPIHSHRRCCICHRHKSQHDLGICLGHQLTEPDPQSCKVHRLVKKINFCEYVLLDMWLNMQHEKLIPISLPRQSTLASSECRHLASLSCQQCVSCVSPPMHSNPSKWTGRA